MTGPGAPSGASAGSADALDAQVERASHLFDLGRAAEAEQRLRAVLAAEPGHFEAGSLLSWVLYKEDRDEEAYQVAEQLIVAAPDRPIAHLRAGWALRALGRDHEAETHARHALRLAPHEPDAHRLLAQALGTLKGRRADALAAAQEGVRLEPDNVLSYATLAMVHIYARRWDAAEQAMVEALARQPMHAGYRMRLGIIRGQLGRFAAARDDFTAALRQEPSSKFLKMVVDAYVTNGSPPELAGLYRLGSAALGHADLTDAGSISDDPRLLQLQVDLVWSLHTGGDHARAYDLVHAVLAADPGHQEGRAALADLLKTDKRFTEALPIALALRDEGHGTVEVYKTLVWSRFKTGSVLDALDDALEAERHHPTVPNFPNLAARFLIQLDRYEEAAECARRVVGLDPDYLQGQLLLGRALHLADRPEEAVGPLRTACEQDPDVADTAFLLAMCLRTLERYDEAEAAARRGIAIDPDAGRGYAVLVHVLQDQPERFDDCRQACEQALARDPDNDEMMFALALVHVSAESWAQAEPLAVRAHQMRPGHASYHMVAAFAPLFLDRHEDALTEITAYLDRHPDPDNFATVASILEDAAGDGDIPEPLLALYERACAVSGHPPIERGAAETSSPAGGG